MLSWEPSYSLPDQLGDAFAVLYDWFEDGGHLADAVNYGWDEGIEQEPELVRLSELLRDSGWMTPIEIREFLSMTDYQSFPYRIYTVLHCIDRHIGQYSPRKVGGYDDEDYRYDRYGRYNVDTSGYVLPKWARGFRGTLLSNHFNHLVRARVDRRRVPVISRESGTRRSEPPQTLKFAIVPFLYTLDDAMFRGLDHAGKQYFEVVHSKEILRQRVKQAVNAIRDSEVHIAIFPELAMSADLVEILAQELHESELRSGTNIPLAWVIVGSYKPASSPTFPVYNSAYVLEGGGEIVAFTSPDGARAEWIQCKRHRYTLSTGEQRRYGLQELFEGELCPREEAISVGSGLCVFDSKHGRYGVLICEDWAQEQDTCEMLRKMNCSLVFVIVMDGPVSDRRWSAQKGGFFQPHTGTHVVIANSLLLPLRTKKRHQSSSFLFIPQGSGKDPLVVELEQEEEPEDKRHVGLFLDADAPRGLYIDAPITPSANAASLISAPQTVTSMLPTPDLGPL